MNEQPNEKESNRTVFERICTMSNDDDDDDGGGKILNCEIVLRCVQNEIQ